MNAVNHLLDCPWWRNEACYGWCPSRHDPEPRPSLEERITRLETLLDASEGHFHRLENLVRTSPPEI